MAKAKKITKKPSLAVSGLGAPSRNSGNRVMSTSWGIPSNLTSTKKNNRATGLNATWAIGTSTGTYRATYSYGIGTKSSSINLDGVSLGSWFNRSSFYPISGRKLNSVAITVTTNNGKGAGPSASQTRWFGAPRAPSMTDLSFNTENGVISTTIETDAGTDYYERYDTKYAITVTSPFLNDGNPTNTSDSSSTSTSFSINYDAKDYMKLNYDQYIKVVASAHARGYAGDSATVTRTEYISYPAQATIEGVDVSGRDSTGKCTILLSTNSTTEHPVDKVRLQIAADVTYDDADDIPANEWESTDIIDNANCTAMSIATSELIPSRGNHSFVRVVTYHLHEAVLYRYSQPWKVVELETPSAPPASINIEILEARTGLDGKSAVVLLGWNKDGQDDYTGTELTWSNDASTWKSTEEPSHHEFTWSDGEIEYDGVTYHDSAEITIKGLSEGERYFIKARRYLEADNEQYSAYSNTATILTSEIPEGITSWCDRYISVGNPLSVFWTFAGNGLQKKWQIVRVVDGTLDGTVVVEGEGSTGTAQISAERLEEVAINNSLTFAVQASAGSGFVTSSEHTVTIIEQPTLQITGSSLVHVHEEDEQTYTGDIVQIDNSRDVLNVKSLSVDLEPIQDLHGYDKPWVGGAGKNKLPYPYDSNSQTISGVVFTVNADGTIKANGTATAEVNFILLVNKSLASIGLTNAEYILNGCPNGGSNNTYRLQVRHNKNWANDIGSGIRFTYDASSPVNDLVRINIKSGATINNLVFKPMICLGTETDKPYAPYENICPISGRTEVVTQRTGKNLFDASTVEIGTAWNGSPSRARARLVIPVKPNTDYVLSMNGTMSLDGVYSVLSTVIPSPTTPMSVAFPKTINSGDNTYLTLGFNKTAIASSDIEALKLQLELGSTATDYEPYEGDTYTTDLGRTVYGGTLDVVSGVLTVDRAMVDLGTLTFSYNSETRVFQTATALGKSGQAGEPTYMVSDRYESMPYGYNSAYADKDGVIWLHPNGTLRVRNLAYTDATDFKTAMSGSQLVYPIATPQTYQLTPQEVDLLTGQNNVWSDGGDVELTTAEVLVDGDFLRTNDLSIDFKSNQLCDLITIVTSQGATGQFPQGVLMQASGDTIHSDVYRPSWTASNNDLTATINLPTGLNFWDGGRYTVSVVAVDRTTGLRSPEALLTVPVMWANQAVPPEQASYSLTTDTTVVEDEAYYEKVGDDYILVTPVGTENPSSEGWYTQNITSFVTLTVIDEKDSDGDHTQAVQIALTPPTGSRETDVYDIYRMDIENPSLIGEGFPLTHTTTDEYAPFGKDVELKYRIAIRTVDGDVAFSDIEYEADCDNIRFDWAGGSLELPYGNSIGDSFKKDADIRQHMNGTSSGYWNRNIERKSSLNSSIIKIAQPRDIERVRMLARYAGAVFVRLPNGSAFEADVQVTDLSIKNEAVTAVAFDATEISTTREFLLPIPFRLEE